ncbi:MAG: 50S ribosomal protein L11 methyltransferase [Gammaproteobacteria bacterium]
MSWIQISITTTQTSAAEIEDALLLLGAASVTLKDAEDQPILEPAPGETPLWDKAIVTGMFDDSINTVSLRESLEKIVGDASSDIKLEILEDQDWTRAWMEHYHAMQFGTRLWVCPWHKDPPDPDAVNLRLDPGLAFGTGTHPTTSLCLRWLDANIQQQATLLDFGCGSGILAIAALLLGVKHADGVDIDEQALYASKENATANDVVKRLQVFLPAEFNQRSAAQNTYDIVMANILSGPLVELGARLADCVKPGGDIVLSGILREQADTVKQAYSEFFDMDDAVYEEDWVMLHGCRRH